MAESLVDQLAAIDQRQEEQRERWFVVGEDGVKREVRQKFEIAGKVIEVPLIGLERPSRLDLKKIKASMDSDLALETQGGKRRLFTRMFSGSKEPSKIEIEIELEQSDPSEGIMALHKRAANEIKEHCLHIEAPVRLAEKPTTEEE